MRTGSAGVGGAKCAYWALLDRLAELTCGDVPEFATLRSLYDAEPGLRVGDEIQSYIDGRAEIVRLTT